MKRMSNFSLDIFVAIVYLDLPTLIRSCSCDCVSERSLWSHSNDEQLIVDNQTETEAEAEKVTGADTSDEGSVVEVILEKKTPQ